MKTAARNLIHCYRILRERPAEAAAVSTLLLVAIALGIVFYLVFFDQNPPAIYKNVPFPVDKEEYHYGDTVVAYVDRCAYSDSTVHTIIQLEGASIIYLPDITTNAMPGCSMRNVPLLTIPTGVAPGEYRAVMTVERRVNPVAVRISRLQTQPFRVVAP